MRLSEVELASKSTLGNIVLRPGKSGGSKKFPFQKNFIARQLCTVYMTSGQGLSLVLTARKDAVLS